MDIEHDYQRLCKEAGYREKDIWAYSRSPSIVVAKKHIVRQLLKKYSWSQVAFVTKRNVRSLVKTYGPKNERKGK